MNRVLKKYRKWIMVGGGVFIMVAWLLPNGISGLQDPRNRTVATLAGRSVKGIEWTDYTRRFEAIKLLTTTLSEAAREAGQMGIPVSSPVVTLKQLGCETADHFLLLAKEAEREGYVGGAADAAEVLEGSLDVLAVGAAFNDLRSGGAQATQALNFMMSYQNPAGAKPEDLEAREKARQLYFDQARNAAMPNLRDSVMGRVGLREDEFDTAIATYRGIRRMFENYVGTARFSDRRAIGTARRFGESVEADYVLVPSDRLTAGVPEPTAEEIAAHFASYKGVEPGAGEFGIGYRKPARVKLEWIELNKAKIAAGLTLIDAHVREKWNERRPGGTNAQFTEERPKLEEELRKAYAEDVIKIADAKFREVAAEAARKFPQQGKFRDVPAAWRDGALSLADLARQIVAGVKAETTAPDDKERWQSPVELPDPIVNPESGWLSAEDLAKLPGVGAATLARGNEQLDFAQVALAVRELDPQTRLYTQVGLIPVFDRPVSDIQGNHYYFRATAARPAGEPESLDEVRDQIVKDIKRMRAYELLKTQIAKAAEAAQKTGLDAVVEAFAAPETTVTLEKPAALIIRRGLQIAREDVRNGRSGTPPEALKALNVQPLRDAVIAKSALLDARVEVAAQPLASRVAWVLLPNALSAAVVRIEKLAPITVERVRVSDGAIVNAARGDELGPFEKWLARSPYSYEALKTRLDYKQVSDRENKADPAKGA